VYAIVYYSVYVQTSYNAALNACAVARDRLGANDLLQRMKDSGVPPDTVSHSLLQKPLKTVERDTQRFDIHSICYVQHTAATLLCTPNAFSQLNHFA
jgi:pentatricopeptide repeat protein